MKYGQLPKPLGTFHVACREMMFYQYLPIKLANSLEIIYENRLDYFSELVEVICKNFIDEFGMERYEASYIYITAKYMFQQPSCSFNRPGYHSDGFLTNDINYIWYDKCPTVFNVSEFALTLDDSKSMEEMQLQADPALEFTYGDNSLLRLDQYNIHKVADIVNPSMRTFLKISFSEDKYDLIGNSHNHLLDYNWEMKERKVERNIPQSNLTK